MLYHSARGSETYTIVGSPTIVDGVASGFSKNNYLSLGNFPQNVTDLEIQIKFKTGSASDVDVWQGLFSINPYESGHNVYIRYNRNTRQISFSPNFLYGNENFILYSNALEYETWYTYKISKVGNVYTLYKNGVAEDTATSTLAIEPNNLETRLGFVRVYTGSTVGGFNSSIDLKHTYITVNGQPWFGICPVEVKKHQVMGPVGYTVVGSPTITDGVLTGVSSGNDCYTSSSLPSFNELEMVFKAKRYTWPSAATILPICAFGSGNNSKRLTPNASSDADGGTRLFNGSTLVVNIPNSYFDLQTYGPLGYYTRVKVTKNTSDYTYELGLSADGNTWVTNSANYSTNMCTGAVYFLRNSSGYTGSNGEMDLNETYIKVNGKLWFWQPRETEKIVVNGVQVWQKSS